MSEETALAPGCEVLVLEDDALLRKRLAAHLQGLGAAVSEASRIAGGPASPARRWHAPRKERKERKL
jgi:hypothetical protein